MLISRVLFLLMLIVNISCEKDDDVITTNDQGEVAQLPHLWKRSLHKDNIFNSNSILSQIHPVFDQGILLATTEGPGERYINMIDPENGRDIWKWNDIYQAPTEKIRLKGFYQFNNILHYIVGSRHYWINLNDGTTNKKIRREVSFEEQITGLGNKYFVMGSNQDTLTGFDTDIAYEGDFQTGELKLSVVPDFLTDHVQGGRIGQVTSVVPIEKDNKEYLVVAW